MNHPERIRDHLRPWLSQRLQDVSRGRVSDVVVSVPQAPAAGQSNETLVFTAAWAEEGEARQGDYVLRRQPSSHRLFPDADVVRESYVLRGLRGTGVPVPRVLWVECDTSVLGGPFFVMEYVTGTVPAAKPSIHAAGWLTELDPAQRARVWQSAIDTLVAVHSVPWWETHAFLADPESGAVGIRAHLDTVVRRYEWVTGGRDYPVTDAALAWLLDRQDDVGQGEPVLVWGDARVGNMIFSGDLSMAAVIDWEFATIGPPELDVAYWLVFDEFLSDASGFARLEGFPDRAETRASYERRVGTKLRDLEYYEVLSALLVAATVIRQADFAVEHGRLSSTTAMGHNNAFTQMLARRIGMPVPEMSEDFLVHRQVPQA